MLHFLGFMLFFILAVLLVGFLIVVLLVRRLFRLDKGGKGSTFYYHSQRRPGTQDGGSRGADACAADASAGNGDDGGDTVVAVEEGELHFKRKKIFDKDEGEYVSYEEVKE